MSRTLVQHPQPRHPDLLATLPVLRAMLVEQRQFRLEQLADLASSAALRVSADTAFDTAGGGQEEVAEALALAARRALDDVELALARIDSGQYGTCLSCGAAISLERLQILPQSSHCVDCQRRWESGR